MEMMYQYLWRTGALGRDFDLTDGSRIHVANPGRQNFDAGPDFADARVAMGGTVWAGNVEIHVRASDWFLHRHHTDRAYDSVILHVVADADTQVCRADGSPIPTLEFPVPVEASSLYARLTAGKTDIKCAATLDRIPSLLREDWLESLAVERMQTKARRVLDENANLAGDWEQTCFVMLARSLGFGLNGTPFEMLARSLPLRFLLRHSDNLFQLEAMMFGQAGLLDPSQRIFDEYYQLLCREYFFLCRKYSLRPMQASVWKFARTRPQNFPHRRIALLAKAVEGGFSLAGDVLGNAGGCDGLRKLFDWQPEGFWANHYSFDSVEPRPVGAMGQASVDSLIINFAVPVMYAYASLSGNMRLAEDAMAILEELPPEKNRYVRNWQTLGLKADNALRSQALVQLHKEYCDAARCLDCRFANRMISTVAREAAASYGRVDPEAVFD